MLHINLRESVNENYKKYWNVVVGHLADLDRAVANDQFWLLRNGHGNGSPRDSVWGTDSYRTVARQLQAKSRGQF